MINWHESMEQTYEFYKVDPNSWRDSERVTTITSCTITRDASNSTLGSVSISMTEDIGECYIRVYLVANQNGERRKFALGTFLIQTPHVNFDGKCVSISVDGYTPLIELKNSKPPIGYSLLKGQPIMNAVSLIAREHLRAPVVMTDSSHVLEADFVSSLDEDWLTFTTDLMTSAKFSYMLDEMGNVMFQPDQNTSSLQPVYTYTDDNSSILYPSFKDERDLYGIPNVVEVVYSSSLGYRFSRIVNDDENSIVSTKSRGRDIVHRETNPKFAGVPTQDMLDAYATQLLKSLSSLSHKITYSHAFNTTRIGDCVVLNYTRAGIHNVKARIISQSIKCTTGCSIQETAVYTTKLWR